MTSADDWRVLFVRTGGIGNTLAAVPALRALREARPEAKVTVLVGPLGEETLRGCPYVDEILVYDRHGADRGVIGWLKAESKLRRRRFTHVIWSKRFFRLNFLTRFTGAPVRVGFAGYGLKPTLDVVWQPDRRVIDTNLDLVAALGIPCTNRKLEIWPSSDDRRTAEAFLQEKGIRDHPFRVALHPGGVTQRRIGWPVESYAELAVAMDRLWGAMPVLVGSRPDSEQLERVRAITGSRYPDTLAADLNIRSTAHLISLCRFFVGASSGPSHAAQAVGTPSIVYFGPEAGREANVKRWKPEGDLSMAVGPLEDGSHPAVRTMLSYGSEMIRRMKEAGR